MAKIAVFIAVPDEIKKTSIPSSWKNHRIETFYTGMGKTRAALLAGEIISQPGWDWVINLGTAGSHTQKVATLVEATDFVERDVDLSEFGIPVGKFPGDKTPSLKQKAYLSQIPSVICGTGDRIDLTPPRVKCDIYEMEAYALALACHRYKVPFVCVKYISDGSGKDVLTEWESRLAHAETMLVETFKNFLETLT